MDICYLILNIVYYLCDNIYVILSYKVINYSLYKKLKLNIKKLSIIWINFFHIK